MSHGSDPGALLNLLSAMQTGLQCLFPVNDSIMLIRFIFCAAGQLGRRPSPRDDPRRVDTAETVGCLSVYLVVNSETRVQVHISSLALLKMLRHARAGVPMEVMGLMLGKFVDQYTITVPLMVGIYCVSILRLFKDAHQPGH